MLGVEKFLGIGGLKLFVFASLRWWFMRYDLITKL